MCNVKGLTRVELNSAVLLAFTLRFDHFSSSFQQEESTANSFIH